MKKKMKALEKRSINNIIEMAEAQQPERHWRALK